MARTQPRVVLDEGLEPFEVPALWLVSHEPDTYVDITATIDTKLAAIAAHISQRGEASAPWVRDRAETLGAQSDQGFELAEAFKTFTLVDDLVE